jgi:hypothetical protein
MSFMARNFACSRTPSCPRSSCARSFTLARAYGGSMSLRRHCCTGRRPPPACGGRGNSRHPLRPRRLQSRRAGIVSRRPNGPQNRNQARPVGRPPDVAVGARALATAPDRSADGSHTFDDNRNECKTRPGYAASPLRRPDGTEHKLCANSRFLKSDS